MSERSHIGPISVARGLAGLFGLLAFASAHVVAAPTVERGVPNAVQSVTADMLDKLPVNRDFRSILDLHNQARASVGAKPLSWNPVLADHAQQYADALAQTGTLQHSSRRGRENERENIIVGRPSRLSPADLAKVWINEGRLFRPGIFPDTCNGDWSVCGHYTQIIWPTTQFVGCGYARARFEALVCRYSPPGNRDGVAIGPRTGLALQETGKRLCRDERGLVINCGNEPDDEIQNNDGGTEQRDGGDKEKVCRVDVAIHRPISVDPAEAVIEEARELDPGATTLRNDNADWRIGGEVGRTTLPVVTLATDIERTGNANENDLVKVDASNPDGLESVYIFSFPTHAEASRELAAEVKPVRGGRVANAQELAYFGSATKVPAAPGLPRAIPKGTSSFWTEAMLGGRYRMVIGKLLPKITPAAVRYNAENGTTYAVGEKGPVPAFECEDQATLTAAVVDIYQREQSTRLTAFDVFWAGRPHFRARLWPGDQTYTWGRPYRLGAAIRTMPGTAVNEGKVAFTISDGEDVRRDPNSGIEGPKVYATGKGKGSFAKKADIQGGFQIEASKRADVPTVNRTADDRYPHRVSLEYIVNGESLVRPEYLEIILPKVQAPTVAANPAIGTATGVASQVQYSITDQFNRPLTAPSVLVLISAES